MGPSGAIARPERRGDRPRRGGCLPTYAASTAPGMLWRRASGRTNQETDLAVYPSGHYRSCIRELCPNLLLLSGDAAEIDAAITGSISTCDGEGILNFSLLVPEAAGLQHPRSPLTAEQFAWRQNHWGTPRPASWSLIVDHPEPRVASLAFSTSYAPACGWVKELAKQAPTLLLELIWQLPGSAWPYQQALRCHGGRVPVEGFPLTSLTPPSSGDWEAMKECIRNLPLPELLGVRPLFGVPRARRSTAHKLSYLRVFLLRDLEQLARAFKNAKSEVIYTPDGPVLSHLLGRTPARRKLNRISVDSDINAGCDVERMAAAEETVGAAIRRLATTSVLHAGGLRQPALPEIPRYPDLSLGAPKCWVQPRD